jgi:tight adherence protein B
MRFRAAVGALLLVLATLTAAAGATAAVAPVPSTLGELAFAGKTVTGVLTVRGGAVGAEVDTRTVTALVGGRAPAAAQFVRGATPDRSTVLVIDTSGSMTASGMATVRSSVQAFLANVPRDVKIGVVSFADKATVNLVPTTDHTKVQQVVDTLRSKGETALYAGVNSAVRILGGKGEHSLVLLSDGGETVNKSYGAQKSAVDALSRAKIRAEIIGFKTEETQDAILSTFAAAGGGSVAAAGNPEAVRAAFTAAAKALDSQVSVRLQPAEGLVGTQQVVVTGTASGRPFTAVGTVDLGRGIRPTATPTPTVTGSTGGGGGTTIPPSQGKGLDGYVPGTHLRWGLGLAILAIFLGAFGLVVGVVAPVFRSRRQLRVSMIDQYARGMAVAQANARASHPSAVAEQLIAMGSKVMANRESTSRTMQLMDRADLPWRAGEWFILRCVAIVVGAAVGYLLLPGFGPFGIVGLLIGILAGFGLPAVLLRFLANRRGRKFEGLLPDVLMLVATSLSSGFSLPQALDAVARDSAEPAAKEFSRALAETRIGADLPDALERMATRMDSENLRWTVMAIKIQREVGGNLAETLRTTAKTLRERESLRRQVRALSAEGRLSAYILIALPIAVFVYSYFVNYDYIKLLWTHPLGLAMVGGGLVAMVIGVFWMKKVVQIDV